MRVIIAEFTISGKEIESKTFYWMRTFALVAVVMAHADYLYADSQFLNRLITSFSDSGVAVFFFASGAYWRWRPLNETLKHTAKLLPPWIILGSLVYAMGAVSSGFSLISWLCWLIGKNTYLWYMTIYVIIQIVFSIPRIDRKSGLVVCVLITAVSRVLTACFGISGYPAFLNLLNWVGFFAVGVLFRQHSNMQRVNSKYMRTVYPSVAVIAIVLFAYLDTLMPLTRLDYWSYFDCFSQFSWIVVLFFISHTMVGKHGYEIGKESFPIYLLHIPVIGFVTSQITVGVTLAMLISIAIICVLYLCLFSAMKIATMLHLDQLFITITGF